MRCAAKWMRPLLIWHFKASCELSDIFRNVASVLGRKQADRVFAGVSGWAGEVQGWGSPNDEGLGGDDDDDADDANEPDDSDNGDLGSLARSQTRNASADNSRGQRAGRSLSRMAQSKDRTGSYSESVTEASRCGAAGSVAHLPSQSFSPLPFSPDLPSLSPRQLSSGPQPLAPLQPSQASLARVNRPRKPRVDGSQSSGGETNGTGTERQTASLRVKEGGGERGEDELKPDAVLQPPALWHSDAGDDDDASSHLGEGGSHVLLGRIGASGIDGHGGGRIGESARPGAGAEAGRRSERQPERARRHARSSPQAIEGSA